MNECSFEICPDCPEILASVDAATQHFPMLNHKKSKILIFENKTRIAPFLSSILAEISMEFQMWRVMD